MKLTMVHPHTREHYSVIKRDKLLLCATTWMNLQRITLSENSQSQTVLYCYHSIYVAFLKWQDFQEFERISRILGFPGGSEGKASARNVGDPGLIPVSGRSAGEGPGNPTPVFLSGESHGRRSLVGYICIVHGVTESLTQLSDFTWNDQIMERENRWVVVRG